MEKWSEGQLSLKQQEAEQQWTEDNDKAVAQLEKAFGVKINVVSGKSAVAGSMNQNDGSITINKDESLAIGVNHVLAHELTHRTEASGLYEGIAKALVKAYYDYDLEGTPDQWKNLDINSIENEELRNYLKAKYAEYKGGEGIGNLRAVDGSTAWREVIAELAGDAFKHPYFFKNIVVEKPSLGRRLLNWFARTLSDLGITSPYAKYVFDAGNMIRDALLEQRENGYNGDNDSYLGEGETYFNEIDTEMSVEEWDSMFASFVEGNNQNDDIRFSLRDTPLANADTIGIAGDIKYSVKQQYQFQEDKYFARQIDKLGDMSSGGTIKVGTIMKGGIYQGIGLPAGNMYFDVSKVQKALK